LAVALGIGRFAFTPLLPMMLSDGTVTLAEGGVLAMLNYVGYLIGSVFGLFCRTDSARTARNALMLTVLLTFAMTLPGGLVTWMICRTLAGAASALVMIHATAWCMQQLEERGRPALGGMMFCGTGIGIVLTGVTVFAIAGMHWSAKQGWGAFGLLGIAMVGAVWRVFDSAPDSVSQRPLPSARPLAPPAMPAITPATIALTVAYGLAGFGYIITATFLPVIARQAMPGSFWLDMFWPAFGISVTIGAALVTCIDMHQDNWRVMLVLYIVQAIGVCLAAIWPTPIGFALSSVLVGLPFTALIAFAMREARRLSRTRSSDLISVMTAAYASGQIAGPPLASALVARTGSFSLSLAVASGALITGAVICFGMCRATRQERRLTMTRSATTRRSNGA